MIYIANKSDLASCVPCAQEFHAVYDPDVEFSQDAFIEYWNSVLDTNQGFILLVEHKDGDIIGGAGGVVTNFQTSKDLVAIEMFWWIHPEFRGSVGMRLYKEFEQEARKRGAKRLMMAYMANSMPDKLEKFYRAKGFVPFEHHVIKAL